MSVLRSHMIVCIVTVLLLPMNKHCFPNGVQTIPRKRVKGNIVVSYRWPGPSLSAALATTGHCNAILFSINKEVCLIVYCK